MKNETLNHANLDSEKVLTLVQMILSNLREPKNTSNAKGDILGKLIYILLMKKRKIYQIRWNDLSPHFPGAVYGDTISKLSVLLFREEFDGNGFV